MTEASCRVPRILRDDPCAPPGVTANYQGMAKSALARVARQTRFPCAVHLELFRDQNPVVDQCAYHFFDKERISPRLFEDVARSSAGRSGSASRRLTSSLLSASESGRRASSV